MRYRAPTPTTTAFRMSPRVSYIVSSRRVHNVHPQHPFYPPFAICPPIVPGTPRAAAAAARAATAEAIARPAWWEPFFERVGDELVPIVPPAKLTWWQKAWAYLVAVWGVIVSCAGTVYGWSCTAVRYLVSSTIPDAVPADDEDDDDRSVNASNSNTSARSSQSQSLSLSQSTASIDKWVAHHAIPAASIFNARTARRAAAQMRREAAEDGYEVVERPDPVRDPEYARVEAKVQAAAQCESTFALMWCISLIEHLAGCAWCCVVPTFAVVPMAASLVASAITFVFTFSRRFRASYAATSWRFVADLLVVGWMLRLDAYFRDAWDEPPSEERHGKGLGNKVRGGAAKSWSHGRAGLATSAGQ